MITEQERQAIVDAEQLKWLPVGYWVSAGFLGLYSLLMAAYFGVIGLVFLAIPADAGGAPPQAFGWVFVIVGASVFLFMAALVALKVFAGFWIRARRHRVATMIIAGITCTEIPYGTVVGVATLVALSRPSVRALYDAEMAHGTTPMTPMPVSAAPSGIPAASDSVG